MAKFKIGQKIRCVDTNWQISNAKVYPVYQGIYTVSDYWDGDSVSLKEIPLVQSERIETYWLESHFEPATESNSETMMIAKQKLEEFNLN